MIKKTKGMGRKKASSKLDVITLALRLMLSVMFQLFMTFQVSTDLYVGTVL